MAVGVDQDQPVGVVHAVGRWLVTGPVPEA
jgi:hypothetical protein